MSILLIVYVFYVEMVFGLLFNFFFFILKKGDWIGFIGYNGCGKSILLQVLDGIFVFILGSVLFVGQCLMVCVEQYLLEVLYMQLLLQVVLVLLFVDVWEVQCWLVECLLVQMGFFLVVMEQQIVILSGGQYMCLLLVWVLICQFDLFLLDELGNYFDLFILLWLESFL